MINVILASKSAIRKAKVVFEATLNRKERIIVAADQNIVFNNVMEML